MIKDALDALTDGRRHHLLPLSVQLRALITERSPKAVKPALLLSMANLADVSLDVYAMKSPKQSDGLVPGYAHQYISPRVSYRRIHKDQTKMHIDDALEIKIAEVAGRWLSTRDIITLFSQQAGGAHFGNKIDRHLLHLLMAGHPYIDVVAQSLHTAGLLSLEIGCSILRSVVSQTLYIVVSVPEQDLNQTCPVFDAAYPKSRMRLMLFLTPEKYITMRLVDYMGIQHVTSSRQPIELGRSMIIIISIEPRDDLTTDVRVIVDDQDMIAYMTRAPLEIYQDIFKYALAFNSFAVGERSSAVKMGLGRFLAYNTTSWTQRGRNLVGLSQIRKQENRYWWLEPGQCAFKPAGRREFVRRDLRASSTCGPKPEAECSRHRA